MILAILTAWLAYKRAKANGRNPWVWALAGAAVFIGTQFVIAFGAGIALAMMQLAQGVEDDAIYETLDLPIRLVAIVGSLVASWVLLKYLDRPTFPEHEMAPPPPPNFG